MNLPEVHAIEGEPGAFYVLYRGHNRIVRPSIPLTGGKTPTKAQRIVAVAYFVTRDGNQCMIGKICGNASFPNPLGADIDHIDGNRFNWLPLNCRLACHADNAKEQQHGRVAPISPDASGARDHAAWNSVEGLKSDIFNALFDRWMQDEGPTGCYATMSRALAMPDLKPCDWMYAADVCDLASATLIDAEYGTESPMTYDRYLGVRRFTYLELGKLYGRKAVRLRPRTLTQAVDEAHAPNPEPTLSLANTQRTHTEGRVRQ